MKEDSLEYERRKHARVEASFFVVYRVNEPLSAQMMVNNRQVQALMLDLSEGGMAFISEYDLPKGTIISMEFTLINEAVQDSENRIKTLHIDGQACYSGRAEGDEYRLGINFTRMDKKAKEIIANFVKTISGNNKTEE